MVFPVQPLCQQKTHPPFFRWAAKMEDRGGAGGASSCEFAAPRDCKKNDPRLAAFLKMEMDSISTGI